MRHLLRYASDFESACHSAKDPDTLANIAADALRDIGFPWFALVGVGDNPSVPRPSLLLTNYPAGWVNEVLEKKLYRDDPVNAAALKSVEGVCWHEIGRYIDPTPQQADTIIRARDHGLKNGYTIAFHDPNYSGVLFSAARYNNDQFGAGELVIARILGAVLHSSASRFRTGIDCTQSLMRLSPRQIECIKYISRGCLNRPGIAGDHLV